MGCVFLQNVVAQHATSASMGLKGKVLSYTTISFDIYMSGRDLAYYEYMKFDPEDGKVLEMELNGFEYDYSCFNFSGKLGYLRSNRLKKLDGSYYSVNNLFKYAKNGLPSEYIREIRNKSTGWLWKTDYHCVYSDYKFDEFGNWIGRKSRRYVGRFDWYGTYSYEIREIDYEENWYHAEMVKLQRPQLTRLEKKMDLDGIRKFYQHCEPNFYDEIIHFWNKHIFDALKSLDELKSIANYNIATQSTKDEARSRWSKIMYENIVENYNPDKLYELAQDTLFTEVYQDSLRLYWNKMQWENVDIVNYKKLAQLATHPYSFPDLSNKGWKRVQQLYWKTKVDTVRDFRHVKEFLQDSLCNKSVFGDSPYYVQRIDSLYNCLRMSEIDEYLARAKKAEKDGDLQQVIDASQHVLAIAPDHHEAVELSAEAAYSLISRLKKDGNVAVRDYTNYISSNPNGKYTPSMRDERAMIIAKQSYWKKDYEAFDSIDKSELSKKIAKKVSILEDKTFNRQYRGNFFHIGVGAHFAGNLDGSGALHAGGGAFVRFGWTVSPVNVAIGANYMATTLIGDSKSRTSDEELLSKGVIGYRTFAVPVQLRWNVVHNPFMAFYIGAGMQFNFNINKGCIRFAHDKDLTINDSEIIKKKTDVSGYYSLGYTMNRYCGFELFVLHDINSPFNKEYVQNNYGQMLKKGSVNGQLKSNIRMGISMYFFY